jgi:hypothetical protein
MKRWILFVLVMALGGCGSSPRGSNWLVADFDKYNKRYDAFPTEDLTVGMARYLAVQLLGDDYEVVEASADVEVLAYRQWVSVQGPDYVGRLLYLRFESGSLVSWRIGGSATP